VVHTSSGFVDLKAGARKQKLYCASGAVWEYRPTGAVGPTFLLAFLTISDDYNFSKRRPTLSLVADGRPVSLTFSHGVRGRMSFGSGELFFFRATRATLAKIASAKDVQIHLNNYSGPLGKDIRELIEKLLAGS
jgi:hypothetical protein